MSKPNINTQDHACSCQTAPGATWGDGWEEGKHPRRDDGKWGSGNANQSGVVQMRTPHSVASNAKAPTGATLVTQKPDGSAIMRFAPNASGIRSVVVAHSQSNPLGLYDVHFHSAETPGGKTLSGTHRNVPPADVAARIERVVKEHTSGAKPGFNGAHGETHDPRAEAEANTKRYDMEARAQNRASAKKAQLERFINAPIDFNDPEYVKTLKTGGLRNKNSIMKDSAIVTGDRIHAPTKLSVRKSLTPEGYLLCEAVPIARTGQMVYSDAEIPAISDGTGRVVVDRAPEDVFHADTIASFEGKPVTVGHPPPGEAVGPHNFKDLACGVATNVRRGLGIYDDYLFADLLITDAGAIAVIQKDGVGEVSCGYAASYENTGPGRARQKDIIGNHVALVKRGRCGPSCAIGDELSFDEVWADDEPVPAPAKTVKHSTGDTAVTEKKRHPLLSLLRRAFIADDESQLDAIVAEVGATVETSDEKKAVTPSDVMDALQQIKDEFAAFKKGAKSKKGDDEEGEECHDTVINSETGEKLDMAGVKLWTGDAVALVQSRAEILMPGFRLPTFDAKATDAARAVAACTSMRKVLHDAVATDAGKKAIEPFLMGRAIGTLDHASLNAVFAGAAELAKIANNGGASAKAVLPTSMFKDTATLVDQINEANRKYYGARQG